MKYHRLNELLELLLPARQNSRISTCCNFAKLAKESGFDGPLHTLTDDILIYHLKMRGADKTEAIHGLKKIMKKISKRRCCARGIIKD